ncbi:MAG: hypothetical protein GF317_14945 [Candidatus Lokiarchaeota archaeon]|nr:hypothetical protein [Candidatus Lokiarchaeota archaeon]MBD3200889.1 hypothetical protein [Candidatus Lokiarchaeota archaeon]
MNLADKNLKELTKIVFSKKYNFVEDPQELKGNSGRNWKFDAIVHNNENDKFGIFIRDWKREISITQLRQLHKACLDVNEIAGGIMVCNLITDFSKDYSKQFGIQLLSKGYLMSKLRTQQFQY